MAACSACADSPAAARVAVCSTAARGLSGKGLSSAPVLRCGWAGALAAAAALALLAVAGSAAFVKRLRAVPGGSVIASRLRVQHVAISVFVRFVL